MSGLASWEIAGGGYRAIVLEAGGGLGDVHHGDDRIVRGSDPAGAVSAGRGQVLAPWPNRLRDGRYTFADTSYQLALSEPKRTNASHGLVRWCSWQLDERTADQVTVSYRLAPQSGYPWPLHLTARYAVAADGLSVRLTAENIGDRSAPFAIGLHPYLDAGVPLDEARLVLPAATRQEVDDRMLPTRTIPVGDHDFRLGRSLRDITLDDGFTDLERDDAGWAVVRLEGAHAVELAVDGSWHWLQAYTGDDLPVDARTALAVEPMSAPADAFNSGTDLVVLEPGSSWTGAFRISAD